MSPNIVGSFAHLLFFVLLIPLSALFYARYLRLPTGKTVLLLLAGLIGSVAFGVYRQNHQFGMGLVSIGFAYLLPLVAIPFLAKLYLKWIAGQVTDAEKAHGMEGIRAWLRGGNLLCAVLISLCLWIGFGYSFWMPVALALMVLLAFPVLNMAMDTNAPQTPTPATDTLSPERERVLKMLDDGKITAPESAELLNALAHSAPARAPQSAPAPHRKMVWLGAALLLIGFFLPWFAINNHAQEAVNNMIRQFPNPGGAFTPFQQFADKLADTTVYVAAGDIAHGLGWWVLVLGIAAAALPFVAANLDSQTCQKVSLITLLAGAIILIYLFTQCFSCVSIGILLALAGYALEVIGVLKARKLDWSRAMQ
jgi:hypothetical protein